MMSMNPSPRNMHISPYVLMIVCCFLVFVSAFPSLLSALELIKITAAAKAETEEDIIRLGNIAEIKGSNLALIKVIQDIEIGKAPLPGKSCPIDRHYIERRLEESGINTSQIAIEIPETIEVTRGRVEIPKERIEKVVTDFISEQIVGKRSGVRLKHIQVESAVLLPAGNITYQCIPPKTVNYSGITVIPVVFRANGLIEKKVMTYATIEGVIQVVVSQRPVRRYQIITDGDIQLEEMSIGDLPRNVITDSKEVIGKRARRALSANMILVEDFIELPPLVKRGDAVHIIAESGTLKITAIGEVRETGCRGATVKVLNHDSKKEIYARVMDSTTVRVDF